MKVTVCVIIKAPHHIIIAIKFSSQQVYVHGYTTRTPMALPRTRPWRCHAHVHGIATRARMVYLPRLSTLGKHAPRKGDNLAVVALELLQVLQVSKMLAFQLVTVAVRHLVQLQL